MTQTEFNKKGGVTVVNYYSNRVFLKEEKVRNFAPLLPGDTLTVDRVKYSVESIKFAKVGRWDYVLQELK